MAYSAPGREKLVSFNVHVETIPNPTCVLAPRSARSALLARALASIDLISCHHHHRKEYLSILLLSHLHLPLTSLVFAAAPLTSLSNSSPTYYNRVLDVFTIPSIFIK